MKIIQLLSVVFCSRLGRKREIMDKCFHHLADGYPFTFLRLASSLIILLSQFFSNGSDQDFCNPYDANMSLDEITNTSDDCLFVLKHNLTSVKFLKLACPYMKNSTYIIDDYDDLGPCTCY